VQQANELHSLAEGPDRPMQIIWTSSSNASKQAFQLDDIQHARGSVSVPLALFLVFLLRIFLHKQK